LTVRREAEDNVIVAYLRRVLGFALTSLVACGGRLESKDHPTSALTTGADGAVAHEAVVDAAAFDRPVEDGGADAPTPVDTGTTATSCHCVQVTVSCSSDLGYASSDRAACTLALPLGMCGTLGLVDGANADPIALLGLPLDGNAVSSTDDVYAFCAVKHEARHTCDAPAIRNCQSEQNAYTVSADCMRGVWASSCGVSAAPAWCDGVARAIAAHDAAYAFNVCACDAQTTCNECQGRCRAQFPEVTSTCRDSAKAYCAVNGK
jgi:hypothetical protein